MRIAFEDIFDKLLRVFKGTVKIILIILVNNMNIYAQHDFESYVNKVFFNVFSKTPDSSIRKFLSDFAPILLHPPENVDNWTAYPSADFKPPVEMIHSYVFRKHPFIETDIIQGEFKIYTAVYDDTLYHNATTIKNIQVILEFDKLDDAIQQFEKLRNDLIPVAKEDTYYEDEHRRLLQVYSSEATHATPSGVRIHLLIERGFSNLYQLSISIG
jgi:hypothetical protein